jgi:hypothetical protein
MCNNSYIVLVDWEPILHSLLSLSVFDKGHHDLYGEGTNKWMKKDIRRI